MLGREPREVAVVDRAEGDALLVALEDRVAQREHLEAAGVGQDRPVPGHELVQPAELGDQVGAGAEVQVVGVGEDDLRAEGAQLGRIDALDRRLRPNRHERGRAYLAVGGLEDPGASGAVGGLKLECAHAAAASNQAAILSAARASLPLPHPSWVGLAVHPRSRCERTGETRAGPSPDRVETVSPSPQERGLLTRSASRRRRSRTGSAPRSPAGRDDVSRRSRQTPSRARAGSSAGGGSSSAASRHDGTRSPA